MFFIQQNPSFGCIIDILLKCSKIITQIKTVFLPLYMFSIAVTPAACILCLLVIQIWCHSCTKKVSPWLPIILILLSNDIKLNPGPLFQNTIFSFMNWNLNSLAKGNFERVRLIEAHNSIFNYDLISICETSLNDSVEIPDYLMNTSLYQLIILLMCHMVGWVFFLKSLFQLFPEKIWLLMNLL